MEEDIQGSDMAGSEMPSKETAENQNIDHLNNKAKEMEVHHHAHHEGKRNWRSYGWEFLMLFLAVFCGFLAEYQLEHKIERERVKKYMHDMVVNLKQDTLRVNQALDANVAIGKGLDSLRAEIALVTKGQASNKRIYQLWMTYNNVNGVLHNRSTLKQLESSGSLRLVKNDELVNAIHQYYDRKVIAAEVQWKSVNNSQGESNDIWKKVLDLSYLDKLLMIEYTFGEETPENEAIYRQTYNALPEDVPLLYTDPKELRILYNHIADQESQIKAYNSFLRWSNADAKELIKQIEKEYNF